MVEIENTLNGKKEKKKIIEITEKKEGRKRNTHKIFSYSYTLQDRNVYENYIRECKNRIRIRKRNYEKGIAKKKKLKVAQTSLTYIVHKRKIGNYAIKQLMYENGVLIYNNVAKATH